MLERLCVGSHSLVTMLLANPRIQAHVLDPLEYPYSAPVAALLRASFGERLTITRGISRRTLPGFVKAMAANGSRCDVVLVDGDHGESGVRFDVRALAALAHERTRLLIDDVVPVCALDRSVRDEADAAGYCAEVRALAHDRRIVGPGRAVRLLAAEWAIRVLQRYGPFAMGSAPSPCFRVPQGVHCGGRHQFDWGFVVAAFRFKEEGAGAPGPRALARSRTQSSDVL